MIETVINNGISLASTNINKLYSNEKEQQFFSFMKNLSIFLFQSTYLAKMELLQYLKDDDVSLRSFHKYSKIKISFLKYNIAIISSTLVERLFSFAGLILSPRRNSLKNDIFEKCVLLKGNKRIVQN